MSEPAQEYLKECFDYDSDTGVLTWRRRPREHFDTDNAGKIFNSRFSGQEAGGVDHHNYLVVKINGKTFKAHRIIWCWMTGSWPKKQIDHINHNRANNWWDNLREVTGQENGKNRTLNTNNTSGVTGVRWHKAAQKWISQIKADGKYIYLGCFESFDDAEESRKTAEIKYGFHPNHGRSEE